MVCGGQLTIDGFVVRRARTASARDDLADGDTAAPAAKRDCTDSAANHITQAEIAFPLVRLQASDDDRASTNLPPLDDGENGASATSAMDDVNDSGSSGLVADGTALVQVHADAGEATAAAANGPRAADRK